MLLYTYNIIGDFMLSSITINDLKKVDPKYIIDIRSIEKYNSNHIPNSINVPYEKLIVYPYKYLNKNQPYYILCQTGEKSLKVCQILIRQGYKAINIKGGYEEWILNS